MSTPAFGIARMLLVGTGALSVAMLPFWLNWLRRVHPDLALRVVLTRGARRFVSADAVSAIARTPVLTDGWDDGDVLQPPHIDLARWSDLVVVYPASAHFVSRFALGAADTPVMLALHAFTGPVAVAPALPPGVAGSPAMRRHLAALDSDPRVVLAPTVVQRSHTTQEAHDGGVAPLSTLLTLVTERRLTTTRPAPETAS